MRGSPGRPIEYPMNKVLFVLSLLAVLPGVRAEIPADIAQAFQQAEGQVLGVSIAKPREEWMRAAFGDDQAQPPGGAQPIEVRLGKLLQMFESQGEAIMAARLREGAEVLKRRKGPDQKAYFAIYAAEEFETIGRYFSVSTKGGLFTLIERDRVAEESFRAHHDAKRALLESNEDAKGWRHPVSLRRYAGDTPEVKALKDLPVP